MKSLTVFGITFSASRQPSGGAVTQSKVGKKPEAIEDMAITADKVMPHTKIPHTVPVPVVSDRDESLLPFYRTSAYIMESPFKTRESIFLKNDSNGETVIGRAYCLEHDNDCMFVEFHVIGEKRKVVFVSKDGSINSTNIDFDRWCPLDGWNQKQLARYYRPPTKPEVNWQDVILPHYFDGLEEWERVYTQRIIACEGDAVKILEVLRNLNRSDTN